jgi:hypothetical protein
MSVYVKALVGATCSFACLLPVTLHAQTVAPTQPAVIQTAPYIGLRVNLVPSTIVEAQTTLSPNQVVVAYQATPRGMATTTAPSLARSGSYPVTLPANYRLFEVGLSGVTGYCALRATDQGVRRSQCFIDLNNDGKFDASYITNRGWQGQTLYWGQVASLASIPPLPYQVAPTEDASAEPITYYFKRIRNQKAEFQIGLATRATDLPVRTCAIDGATPCTLGNHVFVFEAARTGVKVLSVTPASEPADIVYDR